MKTAQNVKRQVASVVNLKYSRLQTLKETNESLYQIAIKSFKKKILVFYRIISSTKYF